MKILIVSQYFYPEQFQINEIAPELLNRGHEVTVLCGVPNYPRGFIYDGYENAENRRVKEIEYLESTGIRVVHVKQFPRHGGVISLVNNYLSFAKNSIITVRHQLKDSEFDVVLGYQLSPITSMLAAIEYKKLTDVPVLFYTLDIWPASAEGMLKSKRNPLYYVVEQVSRRIYSAADKIVVTSRPFIEYLNRVAGYPKEKMAYLPQHADMSMIDQDLGSNNDGVADFMFAGNLGTGQRLEIIVEAARLLGPRDDYKIHIVGDGRMRVELEMRVKDYGLQGNVIFYGNQKREDMPSFYKKADALLITLRGNNDVGNTMPGKLQTYMTVGKPIFGAINGAANDVIVESQCGACVQAGDYRGLSELMHDFIKNPQKYDSCGKNARRYFMDHFTMEKFIVGLENELYKLIK